MKNSQVAVLCGAILAAAVITSATNVWLVRSIDRARPADGPATAASSDRLVIAMMPKAKGDPYFVSCRAGAEEAAKELGVELLWDGPTGLDAARQNEMVENWITRGVDVIAVAVENRAAMSTVLEEGAGPGHQGRDLGCRCRTGRARLLHQPGHRRGHREHADRRSVQAAERQG